MPTTTLTTRQFWTLHLGNHIRTVINDYIRVTQPELSDADRAAIIDWGNAVAWQYYTPEQQAVLRACPWAIYSPTIAPTFDLQTPKQRLNLTLTLPEAELARFQFPLAPAPTAPDRQNRQYGDNIFFRMGDAFAPIEQALTRHITHAQSGGPPLPACLREYPWQSRLDLSTRLLHAANLLRDLCSVTIISVRDLLHLCPELRPSVNELRANRWSRKPEFREYKRLWTPELAATRRADVDAWLQDPAIQLGTPAQHRLTLADIQQILYPVWTHALFTRSN